MGHTMSVHSKNDEVILQFGLKKPAFRICVNTPTTHGSIGLTTGLDPAMTLGCGGWGGNITSDNITPRHLLNTKRVAYEIRPAAVSSQAKPVATTDGSRRIGGDLPQPPARPEPEGIPAAALAARIDQFLASRGLAAGVPPDPPQVSRPSEPATPADFVCEDDVRDAIRAGRKLLIGEKTILTPSARDLGESQKVFVQAAWPH
jgi:acetaldehyde dehydrogenase (acetylating)